MSGPADSKSVPASLQELASEARAINAANGWGTDFDPDGNRDTLPGFLALIHSEITEAWTAERPQEALRELGDVIVRCLDLGELLLPGRWAQCHPETLNIGTPDLRDHTWDRDLMGLHHLTSNALEDYRKVPDYKATVHDGLHLILSAAWVIVKRYGVTTDPEQVVREILAKNRLRGYRHGGRRT